MVDRIWWSSWVHAGCCELAIRGFLACLAGSRVTFIQVSPQSVLFCEPKASVVQQGKQQHVLCICMQTW